MKRALILSALALTLAACSTTTPPVTETRVTATYTYAIKATETTVSVNPGKVGTKFCYTDKLLNGTLVCNNLSTGQRTVQSGYSLGVVFSEPDAPVSIAPALRR